MDDIEEARLCVLRAENLAAKTIGHLGEVLVMLAELSPMDRPKAFDEALAFYNASRPDAKVVPTPGYVTRLVQVGPMDWLPTQEQS